MPLTLDTSGLPSIALPTWQGVPGLAGAAGNNNPLGLSTTTPTTSTVSTFGGLFQSDPNSTMATLSAGASAGAFSIPNLLSNASNAIFGTNLPTNNTPGLTGNTASSSVSTISDIFLRSVIIILGFIFVAVGLSMFKSSDINIGKLDPLKGFKR